MSRRELALREIEGIARDALMRIVSHHGMEVADVSLIVRTNGLAADDDGALAQGTASDTLSGARGLGERGLAARRQLAQLWAVLAAIHSTLASGGKMTQREVWYRLKTTGLFPSGATQVNARILDACAAVSYRSGLAVRREDLGVTAAPRGSVTGCVALVAPGAGAQPQPLDATVWQVPGDTELVRALRVAPGSRARAVLVVEKDTVFRRLVEDRFTERLPCVLVTACGYPDLATRTLVGSLVAQLRVRAFALTDFNPHGLALMLAYKHGTARLSLERASCCPTLHWLGLRASHVPLGGARVDTPADGTTVPGLPPDVFQPFTSRDSSVLAGLARRPEVSSSADLSAEVAAMRQRQVKVELEALHAFGLDYLSRFVAHQMLHFDAPNDDAWARCADDDDEEYLDDPDGDDDGRSIHQDGSDDEEEAWAASDRTACHPRTADLAESMDEDERFLLESPPDW